MGLPNELHPLQLAASSAAYEIEQSIRLNESDSAHFYRNQGSDGNRKTFTISFWTKITDMTTDDNYAFYSNRDSSSTIDGEIYINSQNRMLFYTRISGDDRGFAPDMLFRDPSAWYHVVLEVDTTDSTADDRMKVWVNGVRQTDKALDYDNPTSSQDLGFNRSGSTFIGRGAASPEYGDFYLAEYHFVDGTALDCESFGEFDSNGVWRPIEYTGSHGTQGFYLKFDPDATNGIGHDHSDNSNNWTAYNFVTSGTGTDVMNDTPTKNFCTWNPLDNAGVTISNGNLDTSSGSSGVCRGTFAVSSGKHYWEYSNMETGTGTPFIMGLCEEAGQSPSGHSNHKRAALFYTDGSGNGNVQRYENGSIVSADTVTVPSGIRRFYPQDVLNIAFDADSGKVWFGKNGSYLDSSGGFTGNPSTGANATITFPDTSIPLSPVRDHAGVAISATANFGQREFSRHPGTIGATEYFNTVTWTGNGSSSSREITGCGFQPDLVWLKGRSVDGSGQRWQDVVRGAGTVLQSNSQNAEFDDSANLGAFTSDGFTLTTTGSSYNQNNETYVAWCWKAGGTASANTDGSIDSSVSANNDAGFSIVSWDGSQADGNVGHGLNAAPDLIIFKRRNNTTSWPVFHSALGASHMLQLNETAGKASTSGGAFGS